MTNNLPPRKYADEAERHARENPPHLAELEQSTAELRAEIKRNVEPVALRMVDWIVRLDAKLKRRRKT